MENAEQNVEQGAVANTVEGGETAIENQTKAKREFVKFDTPEQQQAFNQMFKQARAADENNRYLLEHSKKVEDALLETNAKLEAVMSKTALKEGHEAVTTIKAELKKAIEEGDVEKQVELNSQLADIKAEQKIKAIQPRAEPKKTEPAPQQVDPAQQYIDFLAKEKDSSGNIIRPWLHQSHPDYNKALELSKEVAQRYVDQGRTPDIARVLYDVEMEINGEAKEPTKKQAAVLSGSNFTRPKANGKISNLTDDDRKVARRMGLDVERLSKVKSIMAGRNSSVFTSEDF